MPTVMPSSLATRPAHAPAAACPQASASSPGLEPDRYVPAGAAEPCEPAAPAEDPAACEAFLGHLGRALELLVTFLVGYTAPAFFAALLL